MKSVFKGSGSGVRSAFMFLALLSLSVLLSACAGSTTKGGPDESSVEYRAQQRWAAMLAGDFDKAYVYYSPGYRSAETMFDLASRARARRVQWTSADYKDHSCQENTCTVKFIIGYKVLKPVPGLDEYEYSSPLEEKWVKTEGQWWYLAE